MNIVLFSRVPRWYSFKNERLVRRLTGAGHVVAAVVVEQTSTLDSVAEWSRKLGWSVFFRKASQKLLHGGPEQPRGAAVSLQQVNPKVYFVKSHNSPACEAILRRLAPDILVLRGCGILKQHILSIPRLGVINPHYATLPDFRGMDVTEWSVLHGVDIAVSIHTVNAGVDTGVVLKSALIAPERGDTVGSLRDKSATKVVQLLCDAVTDIANGKAFPDSDHIATGGRQFFRMHDRLKALANRRLRKQFGG